MPSARVLKKKLEYARFTHIIILCIIALVIYLFSTIPHKFWVFLTMLVITSSVEPGLIIKRSINRAKGTLLALAFLIPLLYIVQLNYRLIPVILILTTISFATSTLNPHRYDITVFFVTLFVFLLTAQTIEVISVEGPFEMVVNRGICTTIGIVIVLAGDYFLFNSYRYAQKLYLLHQIMVYDFLKEIEQRILDAAANGSNSFIFIEKLRDDFNKIYIPTTTSAESLKLDLKTNATMQQQIVHFQEKIGELRRLAFAICFSEFMLKSPVSTAKHLRQYHQLLKKTRALFIKKQRITL